MIVHPGLSAPVTSGTASLGSHSSWYQDRLDHLKENKMDKITQLPGKEV